MSEKLHHLLVARFVAYYDPFEVLELDAKKAEERLFSVRTQKVYDSSDGSVEWDIGRIRFFWEKLDRRKPLDPILARAWHHDGEQVESLRAGYPVLIDGHHRLCAAVLYGVERIVAYWEGRADMAEWLTGERSTDPLLEEGARVRRA